MENSFSEAARYLSHYREFLVTGCGLSIDESLQLTAESYARKQTLYLLLYQEIVRCHFGETDDESLEVRSMSIATYGMFRAVITMDGLIDGTKENRALLIHQSLVHFEAATRNSTYFLKNSTGRQRSMRRLMTAYLSCYDQEHRIGVTDRHLAKLLFRKSCMILLPVVWAQAIHGPSDKQLTLRSALIKLFVALQIIDDLRDASEDERAGQQTLYRRQLRALVDATEHRATSTTSSPIELLSQIDLRHLSAAERRLTRSIHLFRKAGSEVLASCVGLVHTEVCRHRLLIERPAP